MEKNPKRYYANMGQKFLENLFLRFQQFKTKENP